MVGGTHLQPQVGLRHTTGWLRCSWAPSAWMIGMIKVFVLAGLACSVSQNTHTHTHAFHFHRHSVSWSLKAAEPRDHIAATAGCSNAIETSGLRNHACVQAQTKCDAGTGEYKGNVREAEKQLTHDSNEPVRQTNSIYVYFTVRPGWRQMSGLERLVLFSGHEHVMEVQKPGAANVT